MNINLNMNWKVVAMFIVMTIVGILALLFTMYLQNVWNKARLYDFYNESITQVMQCFPYKPKIIAC